MLDPQSEFGRALDRKGALTDHDRHLLSYYVEIRPLKEVPNTFVALFYSRLHMNKTFIRSSLYQDGGPGVEKKTLTRGEHLFYQESLEAARGLNLRSETFEDIDKITRPGRYLILTNPDSPFFEEQKFFNVMLDQLRNISHGRPYFLITTNVVGFSLDTLGHEVAHALFDSNKEYKELITHFWKSNVSEQDKESIRQILGSIYSSEEVIIDEFQAYLLQPKVPVAQSELLADFVPKYSRTLIKKLKASQLPLPFLSQNSCRALFN